MREILFRGKRVDNGEWVYGLLSDVSEKLGRALIHKLPKEPRKKFDYGTYHIVKLETVGQFIGREDKNGVKIFEGDILEFELVDISEYDITDGCPIFGKPYKVRNAVIYSENGYYLDREDMHNWIKPNIMKNIGNIHDNPELLEK